VAARGRFVVGNGNGAFVRRILWVDCRWYDT